MRKTVVITWFLVAPTSLHLIFLIAERSLDTPQIADFGLSEIAEGGISSKSGGACHEAHLSLSYSTGTLGYQAPEVSSGVQVTYDPRGAHCLYCAL